MVRKKYCWTQQPFTVQQKNNQATVLPSLLFQHIPLKEYETAWNEGKIDTSKHLHGSNNEDVYSPVVNTGLF